MQLNTFAPNAFTGTPSQAAAHLSTLSSTDRVLILVQKDLQGLPAATTDAADTFEDWLALLLYSAIDKAASTPNAERRFNCTSQGLGLDAGFYQSGKLFHVRTVATSFYSEAINLSGKPALGDF